MRRCLEVCRDGPCPFRPYESEPVGVEIGVVGGAEQSEVSEVGAAAVFEFEDVVNVAAVMGCLTSIYRTLAAVSHDHGESLQHGCEPT